MEIKPWIKPILGLFASRVSQELKRKLVAEEQALAASVFGENIGPSLFVMPMCVSFARIRRSPGSRVILPRRRWGDLPVSSVRLHSRGVLSGVLGGVEADGHLARRNH